MFQKLDTFSGKNVGRDLLSWVKEKRAIHKSHSDQCVSDPAADWSYNSQMLRSSKILLPFLFSLPNL
jgi:hypothetical protein